MQPCIKIHNCLSPTTRAYRKKYQWRLDVYASNECRCRRMYIREMEMDIWLRTIMILWATWSIILWLIPYLCVKRPAINVTAAATTINPKSKDRCHILYLYRRWYTANAISTYSSMRKECSTRSLDVMKMDTSLYAGVSEEIETANTRNTNTIGAYLNLLTEERDQSHWTIRNRHGMLVACCWLFWLALLIAFPVKNSEV